MNDENKFASDHSDVESRVFAFRSCMEPALHLFPENIVERLKSDGFFTAPASTKYHGAYEGGLFEHSLNVTNSLVELTKQNIIFCLERGERNAWCDYWGHCWLQI